MTVRFDSGISRIMGSIFKFDQMIFSKIPTECVMHAESRRSLL
jgi:hypothetical protein